MILYEISVENTGKGSKIMLGDPKTEKMEPHLTPLLPNIQLFQQIFLTRQLICPVEPTVRQLRELQAALRAVEHGGAAQAAAPLPLHQLWRHLPRLE